MIKSILNVITQVLAYRPNAGITDNPNQRHFDWTRKFYAVELMNPDSDGVTIQPGGSFTIFDGSETNPLDNTSVLNTSLLPQCGPSNYRLSVSSGTSGFRTPRTITGLGILANLVLQDLTYQAIPAGAPGDAITIAYTVVPAWSNATAYIAGQIISYSGQNYTALQPSTNVIPNVNPTYWEATNAGTAGNEVVTVAGSAISVLMASGASTATQIQTAIQASAPASALVTVTVSGTGSNPQTGPVAATNLSGAQYTTVTINNNALAQFNFGSASLSGVVVGDIMRISGVAVFDGSGPFAFNPTNSGFWVIIGVAGSTVTVVRPNGCPFVGVAESVGSQPSDVQIFSAAGIQVGDKIAITGTFSPVTQGTYIINAVTPKTIDFVSTAVLPVESNLSYVTGTITFYTEAKRFIYLEVNQTAVVQFDADTSQNVKVDPIVPSDQDLVGYLHKWGNSYKCVVQNTSVNPLMLKYFTGE